VPWDPSHVFYVWFDALLNYYTALSYARPGEDLTDRYWPASVHMIGKDILKFHAVYWPALLWAADLEPPRHVFVHGHLAGPDGRKMSKSLGNVIDPIEIVDFYGTPDPLRFYLMRDVTYGADGPVGTAAVASRYESELANDYGNLASRLLAMICRYRDGVVAADVPLDPALVAEFDGLAEAVAAGLDRIDLSGSLELIWLRVRRLNRYVEERKPWELAKSPESAGELDTVLASLHEGLRVVSVLLFPYIPAAAETVLAALGLPDRAYASAGYMASRGSAVSVEKIPPLFPKLDRAAG
jgi:methionyl-tRNA synthetase